MQLDGRIATVTAESFQNNMMVVALSKSTMQFLLNSVQSINCFVDLIDSLRVISTNL